MRQTLPTRKWLLCGDFNHTDKSDNSMGPSPLLHGMEVRKWNRLIDRFDLVDNRLIVVQQSGPTYTRQAQHGGRFDQARLDRSYSGES